LDPLAVAIHDQTLPSAFAVQYSPIIVVHHYWGRQLQWRSGQPSQAPGFHAVFNTVAQERQFLLMFDAGCREANL
jgi:hypothetical protein